MIWYWLWQNFRSCCCDSSKCWWCMDTYWWCHNHNVVDSWSDLHFANNEGMLFAVFSISLDRVLLFICILLLVFHNLNLCSKILFIYLFIFWQSACLNKTNVCIIFICCVTLLGRVCYKSMWYIWTYMKEHILTLHFFQVRSLLWLCFRQAYFFHDLN